MSFFTLSQFFVILIFIFTSIFMKKVMKKAIIVSLLPCFLLTGCNTIRGIGTDIASIGTGIQNTADKVSYNNQLRKQNATTYTTNNPNYTYQNPQNYTYPQTGYTQNGYPQAIPQPNPY